MATLPACTETLAEQATREAEAWLAVYFERRKIDSSKFTPADWVHAARLVPCTIRCWRIGEPVTVKPGEKCSECGKLHPVPTAWERITAVDEPG